MHRGSLFLGRDPGGPTLGVVPGDGATPEGGIWGPGRPSRQTWGGEEVGPCWRDRGAKVTSEGRDDPGRGSWRLVCPRAGEGCGSELCGGAVLFYQVEGLSHLGGSWAFLVADRDPLGAGPCQVEEWELGPVGVALGGWAALWGQYFRLHCRLRRVLG